MGAENVRFKIGGMACSFCVASITKALGRMQGVRDVSVNLTHEEALVEYEPGRIAPEALARTLLDLGYTVRDAGKLRSFEQFDFEPLPNVNRTLVHDLATGRYMGERAPVLIVGPCGTGKSHLAQALGHCAVRQGVDVVFTTCAQLTQSLNAARAIGAYERKLASLARVPLLIIDDFGLKPLRAFPANRLLASATLDRLRHNAYCLVLDGHSYRAPKLAPAATKSKVANNSKSTHS
jgi:DNA replication protein DnaC